MIFTSVNAKIPAGGLFINSVETCSNRKARVLKKSFYPLNRLHYTFDVIVNRMFPKLPISKSFYSFINKGLTNVLSKAETLRRLYLCGFEIIDNKIIGDRMYFVVRKVKEPVLV